MDTADLQDLLAGTRPVTNLAGLLRIEVREGKGRPNRISWVSWREAARLLAVHGDRAAIMSIETPVAVRDSNQECL